MAERLTAARLDSIFTPAELADEMVQLVTRKRVRLVADFAAGHGALLESARSTWPEASILANDIDRASARRLRRLHPLWRSSNVDFLDAVAVRRSAMYEYLGRVDVVLLNPPFSCIGGSKYTVDTSTGTLECGPALAFVLRALPFLRPGGELLALLPAGALDSERDGLARNCVSSEACVEVVSSFPRGVFRGHYQRTSLVRFQKTHPGSPAPAAASRPLLVARPQIEIVRGSLQMHNLPAPTLDAAELVHTSDLREGLVGHSGTIVGSTRSQVRGPAVLIPRVGMPARGKVTVLQPGRLAALSDCVLALRQSTTKDAKRLAHDLAGPLWNDLRAAYGGSCAPYITVGRLAAVLELAGYEGLFKGRAVEGRSTSWPSAVSL